LLDRLAQNDLVIGYRVFVTQVFHSKEPQLIEFITLTILSILVISIMRPGKTPPLENPLTIERPGRYQIKLAPQLNLAQPFIEVIAEHLLARTLTPPENSVWQFEITDKNVAAHGYQHYF